jgi:nicotinamidase/pyrazinamidase
VGKSVAHGPPSAINTTKHGGPVFVLAMIEEGISMNPATTLFYDVDTQQDFLLPEGKLYVPNAERILPQLERLTRFARQQGIGIAGSVDRHFSTDPELDRNGGAYPEHCMDQTVGQQKVSVTAPQHPICIDNRDYTETELHEILQRKGELYIEKQRFDVVTGNRNTLRVFDHILCGKADVVVYGVVTEVCVDQAITGLKDRPVHVHVPLDAIAALDHQREMETFDQWRQWGVHLTTVEEILATFQ